LYDDRTIEGKVTRPRPSIDAGCGSGGKGLLLLRRMQGAAGRLTPAGFDRRRIDAAAPGGRHERVNAMPECTVDDHPSKLAGDA
jgi:hypothetical protein